MKVSGQNLGLLILLLSVILSNNSFAASEILERVINGTGAAQNYPWMASIGNADLDAAHGHFCGAVIIDKQYALTAAHCLDGLESSPDAIRVFIGKSYLNDASAKVVSVDGIILHPNYNPDTQQNDLALIRLSQLLDESSVVSILTPAEESALGSGATALILGWGTTDPNLSVRPLLLQQANIPLIDSQSCQNRIGLDFDSQTMICGGILSSTSQNADGVDACYGDSGSPLLVQTGGSYKLLGLASWGFACASERYWGVYTRVPPFFDWVNTARIIAPYMKSAPVIDGIPKVNSKLTCDGGNFGGDKVDSKSISIQDSESGQVLKEGNSYEPKKSDVGRKVNCVVALANSGGQLQVQSDSVGPIFPQTSLSNIKISRNSAIESAGVNCSNGKCSMLLSFKKAQVGMRTLLEGGKVSSNTWKRATRLTAHAWAVTLPATWKKYSGVLIRSVGVDKRSLLSEARFSFR